MEAGSEKDIAKGIEKVLPKSKYFGMDNNQIAELTGISVEIINELVKKMKF